MPFRLVVMAIDNGDLLLLDGRSRWVSSIAGWRSRTFFPRVAIMGNSHKISLGGGLAVVVHVTWMKIRLGFCGLVWLSIVGQSRSSGVV